jgi:sensor domain CHASE-containing protein
VIALIAILATLAAVLVVPAIIAAVARNVARAVNRDRAASIDQDLVEARLGRIEEAIDAMALQIERLSDHQRALLGAPPKAPPEVSRMEGPR